jgi:hypothetical protein
VIERETLLAAIEGVDEGAGSAESLSFDDLLRGLYPVPSQARVFNLDKILVIGGRGSGKTQIFRALLSDRGRAAVVKATGVKLIHDVRNMVMLEAFSAGSATSDDAPNHPAADAIEAVIQDDDIGGSRRLWLGICLARLGLHQTALSLLPQEHRTALANLGLSASSARTLRAWVDEDVERPFEILDGLDRAATERGLACVFTFDALDRAANRWDTLGLVVGGLLSLALDILRRHRSIRLKVFLRPDLESDAAKGFPDASKLRGYREELSWERADLYRLAFKRMVGEPTGGARLKAYLERAIGFNAFDDIPDLGWTPAIHLDEAAQERAMVKIVGKYMGANPQKGVTYNWIPNHLADAHRRVSPRSFLVAFHAAAKWMRTKPAPSGERLLTPPALEDSVRAASLQRVDEIAEDFPWVPEVQRRMEDLLVPAQVNDVIQRLQRCEFQLPPRGVASGEPSAMLDKLIELGVFYRIADGRLNAPDLYRVAMKMKRRGGISLAR